MLATHKHNASALFWYTQRYHGPRATIKKLRGRPANPKKRALDASFLDGQRAVTE